MFVIGIVLGGGWWALAVVGLATLLTGAFDEIGRRGPTFTTQPVVCKHELAWPGLTHTFRACLRGLPGKQSAPLAGSRGRVQASRPCGPSTGW